MVCEAFSMQVPLPLLMLVLVEAVEVVLEQEEQQQLEVKNLLRLWGVLLRSTTRWTSFSGSCSSAVPSSLALPVRGREEELQRFSVVCAKQSLRAAAVRAKGTDSSGTTSCCCSSLPCC